MHQSMVVGALDVRRERMLVEQELERLLAVSEEGDCGTVQDAMRYSVLGGGKRIRPVLALRVAEMLGNLSPLSIRAAAAVELFHCASLVIDDLPCMDNEQERRGQPTVHVAFGESNAVLAAFGLVALSARCVLELPVQPAQLSQVVDFQRRLLRTLDCAGLIAGQAQDLLLSGGDGLAARAQVNEMKTAPLFEVAMDAGMLGADLGGEARQRLRLFGREFGRAFQLVDDLLDGDVDRREPFLRHLDAARVLISDFDAADHRILELLEYLNAYADQKDHCHR